MTADPDRQDIDERWMRHALVLAERAQHEDDEIPVGAVIVGADGSLLGEGWNRNITECDPTAHAEIVAMRRAGAQLRNHRLEVTGGVFADEAGTRLTDYFRRKRGKPSS